MCAKIPKGSGSKTLYKVEYVSSLIAILPLQGPATGVSPFVKTFPVGAAVREGAVRGALNTKFISDCTYYLQIIIYKKILIACALECFAGIDGHKRVGGSSGKKNVVWMEGQGRDRTDSLTQKAIVVANDGQFVAIEVHNLDALILGARSNERSVIMNAQRCHDRVRVGGDRFKRNRIIGTRLGWGNNSRG
jgi:hypothetical protein